MKRGFLTMILATAVVISAGCALFGPRSFVRMAEPPWTAVRIRPNLSYEEAWARVLDVIARRFDLEMISKDAGYIRTAWSYTWRTPGRVSEDYRARAIIRFSPDREAVYLKTEAHYGGPDWVVGTDVRMYQTLKTDIVGVAGIPKEEDSPKMEELF